MKVCVWDSDDKEILSFADEEGEIWTVTEEMEENRFQVEGFLFGKIYTGEVEFSEGNEVGYLMIADQGE